MKKYLLFVTFALGLCGCSRSYEVKTNFAALHAETPFTVQDACKEKADSFCVVTPYANLDAVEHSNVPDAIWEACKTNAMAQEALATLIFFRGGEAIGFAPVVANEANFRAFPFYQKFSMHQRFKLDTARNVVF